MCVCIYIYIYLYKRGQKRPSVVKRVCGLWLCKAKKQQGKKKKKKKKQPGADLKEIEIERERRGL